MTITTFTGVTPVAEGQTGAAVAATINTALTALYGSFRYDFNQTDSDDAGSDNKLTYLHNKNTRNVTAKLYDSSWMEQNIDGLFSLPSANTWLLIWDTALSETYHLIVTYKPED